MGNKGDWYKREKEIPTDTALNPEAMVSVDDNRGDYEFPYSGELNGTSGETEDTNQLRGEVSKQEKE